MLHRCEDKSNKHYGARGISVSPRWSNCVDGFENFTRDMGKRPNGHTLDRIDPNGNYEPGNCRWATGIEQYLNKRIVTDEEILKEYKRRNLG